MGTETAGVATAQTTTGNSAEGSAALAAERLFNDWIQTGAETATAENGGQKADAGSPKPEAGSESETVLSQSNQDRPQSGEEAEDGSQKSEDGGQTTEAEPAEAEAKAEDDGTEDGGQKPEGSPDPKGVQKKINREVAKRKAAEERAQAFEAELQSLKAEVQKLKTGSPEAEAGAHKEVASAPSNDPVEAVPEVREAKQELAKHSSIKATANELLKQLRQDPDTVAQRLQQAQVKLRDYSEDTIRDYLESAKEEAMTQAAAATARLTLAQERAKAAVQAQRQQAEQLAVQEFPDLADPESELSRQVDAVMSNRPWLKNDPFGRFSAAAAVDRILKAKQKAEGGSQKADAGSRKPEVKPLPKMPSATAAVPAPSKPKQTTGVENIVAVAGDPEKRDRAIEDFFKRW